MNQTPANQPIPPPKSPWWPLFVVGAGVIGALLLVRWATLTPVRTQAGGTAQASSEASEAEWAITRETLVTFDPGRVLAEGDAINAIDATLWTRLTDAARASVGKGPEETRRFVSALFTALDERTPGDRLAVLGRFFEMQVDVDLGLPFIPAAGGTLSSWPTLRVALFDYLSTRDMAATGVLADSWIRVRPGNPAEWAVALRELAAGQSAVDWPPAIRECVYLLVENEAWAAAPPAGWVEALDVIAAGGAVEFLPKVSRLAQRDQARATQQAAHAVLEGLVCAAPRQVLEALNLDTSLFAQSSGLRAAICARADVRVPEQLRALEVYLRRADVLPGERAQFTAQFPHHRASAMPRLLTAMPAQTPEDIAAQDAATVEQIDRWLTDAHFDAWRAAFEKIRARLAPSS